MSESYQTDDAAFAELVDKSARQYERLTDAKLAKKIRHLRGAVGRCSLPRNDDLMVAFLGAACAIQVERARNRKGAR